jgi:diguanylate cyclase (GGDEF)-like protein/hemerythrin-like metal-binding protein
MGAIKLPVLHGLVQHLPLPMVLFGKDTGVGVANDRFAEVFRPGQLDRPELRRLAREATGAWQPIRLRRRDGCEVEVSAQAVAAADGVLVVFDEAAAPLLIRENERLQVRIAELENASATDSLTGAWNRAQLQRTVDMEASRALRSGQPVTAILLDIDHFKRVNDTHGHLAGDAVLREFVARIRLRMRASDSLFRWGGEEFVVLAPAVGYRGGAVLAEGLRRAIAAAPFPGVGPITVSLGVAELVAGESAERWLQRTDEALYAAKAAGRNRIHVDRREGTGHGARRFGDMRRLYWLDAYECGEPAIDAEHRELFELGNALIAAALERRSEPRTWREALHATVAHLVQHFRDEEVLLGAYGYDRLSEHRRAHEVLVQQAGELVAAVENGTATLGHLINFMVNDVIALHLLTVDREFFLQLRRETGHVVVSHPTAAGGASIAPLH